MSGAADAEQTQADVLLAPALRALAASLDVPAPADGALPPLWHWMLFQRWVPASALGLDGHPARGGALAVAADLPRRMWAGGRLSFPGCIRAGEAVQRTTTIESVTEKTGGSGRLVFVTLRHVISAADGVAVIEEQDLVYRGTEGAAVKPAQAAPAAPPGAWRRTVTPDAVLLFRYSALTGNGHRIHYDLDYVMREEGYPGLVVHGPLQATLLADLVRRQQPAARIARLSFRGVRPAFAGRPLTLEAWPDGGVIRLRSLDADGAVCMTAEVGLG